MTETPYEKRVEELARAMLIAGNSEWFSEEHINSVLAKTTHDRECEDGEYCDFCWANREREVARATMEDDRAAGYALVPREATETMISCARIEHETLPKWEDLLNGINAAIAEGDVLKGDRE